MNYLTRSVRWKCISNTKCVNGNVAFSWQLTHFSYENWKFSIWILPHAYKMYAPKYCDWFKSHSFCTWSSITCCVVGEDRNEDRKLWFFFRESLEKILWIVIVNFCLLWVKYSIWTNAVPMKFINNYKRMNILWMDIEQWALRAGVLAVWQSVIIETSKWIITIDFQWINLYCISFKCNFIAIFLNCWKIF